MSMEPRKALRTGLQRTAHRWQEGDEDEVYNWFMASGADEMMEIHCRLEAGSHMCAAAKANILRWQYADRRDRFTVDLEKAKKTLLHNHWKEYDTWKLHLRAQLIRTRDAHWDEYIRWRRDMDRVLVLLPLYEQTGTIDGPAGRR